jgi:hypothetical protein
MSLILILSISLPAFAYDHSYANKKLAGRHGQTQEQSGDEAGAEMNDTADTDTGTSHKREQARLRLKIKIQINEKFKEQKNERQQKNSPIYYSCFNDTDVHWARVQVKLAYNWGLINGYPDGSFGPNGKITGTEGTLMVGRLIDCLLLDNSEDVSEDEVDWSCIPAWAMDNMKKKTVLRIAVNTQCYGQNELNRLQFAVMLAKAMKLEPAELDPNTALFTDQADIPPEDLGYIAALYELGIIQGYDGAFSAGRLVTRAEAAAMLTRVLEILEEDKSE